MKDIVNKTDAELAELVVATRATVREERFKDKFSRKAGVIRTAKQSVARALTELNKRRKAAKN